MTITSLGTVVLPRHGSTGSNIHLTLTARANQVVRMTRSIFSCRKLEPSNLSGLRAAVYVVCCNVGWTGGWTCGMSDCGRWAGAPFFSSKRHALRGQAPCVQPLKIAHVTFITHEAQSF